MISRKFDNSIKRKDICYWYSKRIFHLDGKKKHILEIKENKLNGGKPTG